MSARIPRESASAIIRLAGDHRPTVAAIHPGTAQACISLSVANVVLYLESREIVMKLRGELEGLRPGRLPIRALQEPHREYVRSRALIVSHSLDDSAAVGAQIIASPGSITFARVVAGKVMFDLLSRTAFKGFAYGVGAAAALAPDVFPAPADPVEIAPPHLAVRGLDGLVRSLRAE